MEKIEERLISGAGSHRLGNAVHIPGSGGNNRQCGVQVVVQSFKKRLANDTICKVDYTSEGKIPWCFLNAAENLLVFS